MPVTDYLSETYNQLATILLGWPAIADGIKSGNFIRYDEAGKAFPAKPFRVEQTAGYPLFELDEDSFESRGYSAIKTFANVHGSPSSRIKEYTHGYKLTIAIDDLRVSTANQWRLQVEAALDAAGPRLGLPAFVKSWGNLTGKYERSDRHPLSGGAMRMIVSIKIPVTFQYAVNG